MFQKVWSFLKGKKTYIVSLASAVYGWGISQNVWPHSPLVDFILAASAVASLRHGISTASQKVAAVATSTATAATSLIVCAGAAGLMLMAGCAGLSKNTFNAENLAADAAMTATHGFNLYYATATNGASTNQLEALNSAKEQLYAADQELAHALSVVESLRQSYDTNSSATNATALTIALGVVSDESSNIVSIASLFQKIQTK